VSVNYDGFIDDVSVGDVVLVDGGLISCHVVDKSETDVQVGGTGRGGGSMLGWHPQRGRQSQGQVLGTAM
jgi:hypothetical protein